MRKTKETNQKYGSSFYKIVPTALFGLAGAFYALAPYDLKVTSGLDFGNTPEDHLLFAAVFLVMAGIFWWMSNRKKPILP